MTIKFKKLTDLTLRDLKHAVIIKEYKPCKCECLYAKGLCNYRNDFDGQCEYP